MYNSTYPVIYAVSYIETLQNLIHPVEFPLRGTPLGGFYRAGLCHPDNEDGLF